MALSSPRTPLPRGRARAARAAAVAASLALLAISVDGAVTVAPVAAEPVPLPVSADPGISLADPGTGPTDLGISLTDPDGSHDQHPERLSTTPDLGTGAATDAHGHGGEPTAVANGPALPGTVADSWSAVGTFRTSEGWYASPIHATLMPDGRVFFVGIARDADPPGSATMWRRVAWVFTPPAIGAAIPTSVTIQEIVEPVELSRVDNGTYYVNDDFYCMGATLTHDGRVVTAGGTRTVNVHETGISYTFGLPYETVFDGTTWTRQPGNMLGTGLFNLPTRWYPTLTRLPDRRTLVTGGLEVIVGPDNVGYSNRTVETYDTDTGERTLFSDLAQTPLAIQARDYAHAFVMPYAEAPYDVMVLGEAGIPAYTKSTTPGAWALTSARPGDGGATTNWGTSSALLPLRTPNGEWNYVNGSVLMASGDMHTPFEKRIDVVDPFFGWRPSLDLGVPRHHPSTVLLPDSRTLIVNGHDMDGGGVSVQQAQYVDPAEGFSVEAGTAQSGVTRGYHSIALLLPDGRVLVGGGRDRDTKTSLEKPSFQIYTPDYLSRPRPTIIDAPTELTYGALFGFGSSGPAPTEVMLLALGSMTHSFDSNQRAIELPMGTIAGPPGSPSLVVAGSPVDSHLAPPGHYLLVVLDAQRTPSAASVVHLS